MTKKSFCKKRKFTQSINETEHIICQLYHVVLNFEKSSIVIDLENYCQQRK